ncbi:hypothetical protein ACF07D_08660 [Leucobacter sp. NPDC015123]|uniref:hypothetical protein n=1 Tax=Leucobacter sp. NPDC015123 TaxID=3364129 RepID=UPI0036F4595B
MVVRYIVTHLGTSATSAALAQANDASGAQCASSVIGTKPISSQQRRSSMSRGRTESDSGAQVSVIQAAELSKTTATNLFSGDFAEVVTTQTIIESI